MSLTVRDCLRLPSMSFAKVIAGEKGLDKIVSSVSVLEFIEESNENRINTFTPNELTISAFYMIKDDVEKQCATIKELHKTNTIALVLFYTGYILKEISPLVIQTANQLDFPLIILHNKDYSINYSNLIMEVISAILQDQATAKSVPEDIAKRLSQIPVEYRSMENLLQLISNHYKCNLVLSTNSDIYFNAEYQPFSNNFSMDLLFHAFDDNSRDYTDKKIFVDDKVLYIYKKDFLHIDNSWMTIYASCVNTELNIDDLNDICTCTNYFTTLWGYSLDLQSKNTLVSLILKSESIVTQKFLKLENISFSSISDLIIVDTNQNKLNTVKKEIEALLNEYSIFFISEIIDNHIVILASLSAKHETSNMILYEINDYIDNLSYNASVFYDESNTDITSIRKSYFDYCKCVSLLESIFHNKRQWNINDVSFSKELMDLCEFDNPKKESILQIIHLLKDHSDNLLETMATYFIDCDSQLNKTSQRLSIHRNTLSYRMNKIKEITHTDFTLMPAAYKYYTASAMWRFMKSKGEI